MKIFGAESLLIIQLMFGGEVIEQIPVQKFSDSRMCEQRLYSRAHDSYRMNLLIKYKRILEQKGKPLTKQHKLGFQCVNSAAYALGLVGLPEYWARLPKL